MAIYYEKNGTPIYIGDAADSEELLINVKNIVSLDSKRITELEKMHNEFTLPVLYLSGDISQMTKDHSVDLTATFTNGVESFTCIAKTKWQGQSSIQYPKKNFNIKFIDHNKNKYKTLFKSWFPTNNYHLKGNYGDYSMVRNVVGVQLARNIYPNLYPNYARGVIDSFPCILYINNQWWGCYTWNLSQDADLFAMDVNNENNMCFRPSNEGWNIENFEDRIHDEPSEYQLDKLNRMVSWTKTCSDIEFANYAKNYFDMDSLRYYWLFMDISCAGDSLSNNSTWASWDGNIWYVLWYDLDICFGWNQTLYTSTTDLIALSKTSEWSHKYNPIWERLYNTDYNKLCAIYAKLRQTVFTDAQTIISYFTAYQNMWGAENLQHEYTKWSGRQGSEWNITNCSQWITERLAYCDNKYNFT